MTWEENHRPSPDDLSGCLLEIAVEYWRLTRWFKRLLGELDAGEQKRYQSKFRWFQQELEKALERAGMRIVDAEGEPFDTGTAATPLNLEEFEGVEGLVVDQMIEPIIMGPNGIVKTGTVTLRRVK